MVNVDADIFDNEERVLVNGICKNEKLSTLTRQKVLDSLTFSKQITNDSDMMILGLLDSTYAKVKAMTDEEWDALKVLTPFPVAVMPQDDVEVVPADEEG